MSDDIRALIDKMKAENDPRAAEDILDAVKPVDDSLVKYEGQPATAAKYVAAELARVKAQITELQKQEKALTSGLKGLVPDDKDGLSADGVVVARITRTSPVRVNSKAVEEHFPYDQFPQLYTVGSTVTLNLDKDFKRIAVNGAEVTA